MMVKPLIFTIATEIGEQLQLSLMTKEKQLLAVSKVNHQEFEQISLLCQSLYDDLTHSANPKVIGIALYNFIDSHVNLSHHSELLNTRCIIFQSDPQYYYFPWELLHDGHQFWVENRTLPYALVRMVKNTTQPKDNLKNSITQLQNLLFIASAPQDIKPILDYEKEEDKIF